MLLAPNEEGYYSQLKNKYSKRNFVTSQSNNNFLKNLIKTAGALPTGAVPEVKLAVLDLAFRLELNF